jgi:hypothetical protein
MVIIILDPVWIYKNLSNLTPSEVGLSKHPNNNLFYAFNVIDEQLFFLSAIKYGLDFNVVEQEKYITNHDH